MTARGASTDVGTELQVRPECPVRKSTPRLQGFDYKGRYAYHVVLTVKGRARVFEDVDLGLWCVEQLRESAKLRDFDVAAYCLMPDHMHLLVQGAADSSDLIGLVQNFKQRTAFHFKRESGDQLWQQSYFDRVLRKEDALEDIARYIFQNPVTAGLFDDEASYPLTGGTYFHEPFADRAEAPSLRRLSLVEEEQP